MRNDEMKNFVFIRIFLWLKSKSNLNHREMTAKEEFLMNQIKIKDGKFVVYPAEWNSFSVDNSDQCEYAGIVVLPYRNDIYVFTSMNPIEEMSDEIFDKVVACLGKEYPEIAECLSGQARSPEIYGIVSAKESYRIVKQAWIKDGESL